MPPKRKPDPSGSNDFEETRSRKRKGKGSNWRSSTSHRFIWEQREIEEATRLSLQTRPAAESGESSSSAVLHPTPRITRSSVVATLKEDDDFQEPIALRTRTDRTASAQSTEMTQEFEKAISLTPSTPTESTSTPVHLSERVRMKQMRSEAKRKTRQESSASEPKRNPVVAAEEVEERGPRARRAKFVIKAKLETMLRADNFNQDLKPRFVTEIHRVVRHLSDVTYAASLFLNWFCLRLLRNSEPIPKLTHKKLYNVAALFVGQGKKADADIYEAFLEFTDPMGEDFNRERQFPNIQLSDATEFPNLPFPTGVKRDLAERLYNAICTNQELVYPTNLEIADVHQTSINNLITECRQRLQGLSLTEADYYAKPHLYLPWLYHILERMEQQIIIREPVSQTRATKGFVHRQLGEIVDFRRLPRRFCSTLETHVRDSISMEQPSIQRYVTHSFLENTQRRSPAADLVQRQRRNDLLPQEKAAIDDFVARTRASISRNEYRPEKFTDPRGARLFNILPKYTANEDMKDVCWSLFDMSRIGFRSRNDLDGKALSDKRFTGAIRTDGIALEFICDRPSLAAEAALTPADIATEIDLNTATIWGLDPGIRDVFIASDGVGTGASQDRQRHRIRKTSLGEYYQLFGFKSAIIKRAKHDQANADACRLISNTPSTRTCNWDQFNEALRYIFRNLETIKDYYTIVLKKLKYHGYRNKQKALTEMCKRLFTGSEKYQEDGPDIVQANQQKWKPMSPRDNAGEATRPTVVAFGSGVFRKALLDYTKSFNRNRPNSRKYVVMIDEYLASQICPRCHLKSTANERDNTNIKIFLVLSCNIYHTRWNRDHMASLNIRSIFLHMAANNNNRPEEFRRGTLS
ncbi:hypothetical protein BD408DRAFT_429113 [Parasitella parasitica]|nr:hypothetical protein BD408DRAFT_429113 [Parasitella parasitica]